MSDDKQMYVSLDGGQTFQVAPKGVVVHYTNVDPDDATAYLQVKATHEGLITDRHSEIEDRIGTRAETVDEIVEALG